MSADAAVEMSPWRAWFALVGLSIRRQTRSRAMVWVALGLLALTLAVLYFRTARFGWTSGPRRYYISMQNGRVYPRDYEMVQHRPIPQPTQMVTMRELIQAPLIQAAATPTGPAASIGWATAGSLHAALEATAFHNFTNWLMFSLFIGFLLPIWCLSFATEALGSDRESRSLVWLLTRPMPRWAIYIAKYLGMLPWVLGLTIGGFAIMCAIVGPPGRLAFRLYWPAIVAGTLAFTSLFHLFSAALRRPTVVGLVYCFFLEAMLGQMPGLLKRSSISFYIRCLIFDSAGEYGITPEKPSVYLPVSGWVAWLTLSAITATALALGAWIFSRAEYRDDGT